MDKERVAMKNRSLWKTNLPFVPCLLAGLVLASIASAQIENMEFITHANGLIYDEETIAVLGSVVDSLNQKFQACALDREYRAEYQATANVLEFRGKEKYLKKLKRALERKLDYPTIKKE